MSTRALIAALAACVAAAAAPTLHADPFPPAWGPADEAAGPVHFAPVPWPDEPANPADCGLECGGWKAYSRFQNDLADPRTRDESNGGTAPQNYVNVSSSCIDRAYPSIYYHLHRDPVDPAGDVLLFRWRVEQIAHTYATGPSAGNFGAGHPWSSALWTVLFDIDGDGFRDLAAHLNGSSGSPATPIDMLAGIWGDIPTQSIDYTSDPNIRLIAHNPTAFTSGSQLLNFQGALSPTTAWPHGGDASSWDYGSTRARRVSTNACTEYFIDYQIPVRMLDASASGPNPALNGPKIDRNTPISMLFCTANSLNNPFQKDCAIDRNWAADANRPAPFGDYLSFDKEDPYAQPIISDVSADGPPSCPGNYSLKATVQDTLAVQGGTVVPSVQRVDFFYWHDADGDGTANDPGGAWVRITPTATLQPGSLNTWTGSWNATTLLRGKYLIGAQALDDNTIVDDNMAPTGVDHRTFSYLPGDADSAIHVDGDWRPGQQAAFPAHAPAQAPLAGEDWYGNPDVTGLQTALVGVAINACGIAPTIDKAAAPDQVAIGEEVGFTVTIANPTSEPLTLSRIEDVLPDGFVFVATDGVFSDGAPLAPDSEPGAGASGAIAWTFADPAIPAGASLVLHFTAQAGTVAGSYNNTARALTGFGTLDSAPAAVAVDAARLSLSKVPDRYSVEPDGTTPLVYTLRYANDSALTLSAATLTDVLPAGTSFVACSGGSGCANTAGTVEWTLGTLAPGQSGTATLTVTVDGSHALPSLVNTATLAASAPDGTPLAREADATVAVNVPVPAFTLRKTGSVVQTAPGGVVTWTLQYENFGSGAASGALLTDALPDGFTFASCAVAGSTHFAACTHSGGVVSFHDGSGAGVLIPEGAVGSVTVSASAAAAPFTYTNPAVNEARLTWAGDATGVHAESPVGVTGQYCSAVYYFMPGGLATETAPEATDTTTTLALAPGSPPFFFDGSAPAGGLDIGGQQLTISFYMTSRTGNATFRVRLFDEDALVQLADSGVVGVTNSGGVPVLQQFTASIPPGTTVGPAAPLRWEFTLGGSGQNVDFLFGSQQHNSRSSFCTASAPASLTLAKAVDTPHVDNPPATLTYTLDYANAGGTGVSGAQLVDALPAGISFVGATMNGTPVTPAQSGQVLSFAGVSGAGEAAGTIGPGASGSITITATVDAGADGRLTNTATLSASGVPDASASADVLVGALGGGSGTPPQLVASKSVDASLLGPGDSASYTLTVVNVGGSAASNVVVTDDYPEQPYFSYGGCSTPDGSCAAAGGVLTWTIGSLAAGASATATLQMQAATSGLPPGTTQLDNTMTVADDEACTGATPPADCSSDPVTVTLTGAPQLALSKQVSPAGPHRAGDVLTYTLTLANTGASAANGVRLSDPVPAHTQFSGGITASQGSGAFDAVDNRVVFDVGSLAAGASATLGFDVEVSGPLPAGITTLTNTARASALNAAGVQASVATSAFAEPVLALRKSAPASVRAPAALLSTAASGSTTVHVDDAAAIEAGRHVRIGGSIVRVLAVAGRAVTLDGAVTAAAGAPVDVSFDYSLTVRNEGDAIASGVLLTDPLPANVLFAAASPAPDAAPAAGSGGTVQWDLGTLPPGAVRVLQVSAIATATGTLLNTATVSADGGLLEQDEAPTAAGGLVVDKSTDTPLRRAGESATWRLRVVNTLAADVAGVTVTDLLPSGFSYASTSAITIDGTPVGAATQPVAGEVEPLWGAFTLPAGGELEIVFDAAIGAEVGPATYDNGVAVEAGATGVTPFDPLATTAEDVTVLADGTGMLEGIVYHDTDGDGSFDATSDTPLAGVDVVIIDATDTLFVQATGPDGRYARVVAAGEAIVDVDEATLGAALVPTTGADGVDPDTLLVPDGGSASKHSGFVAAGGAVGSIVGRVWHDADGDAAQQAGEPGMSAVRIALSDADGTPLRHSFSAQLGDFAFANLAVGDYLLTVVPPAGYAATTPASHALTVSADASVRGDFGLGIAPEPTDADLSVGKDNGGVGVVAGSSTTWTVTVHNAGPAAADGAVLTDAAQAGLSKTAVACVSATGGAVCPASVGVAALESGLVLPTLPVGGGLEFTVTAEVTASAGASVANTASIAPPAGIDDPVPGNDSATDTDPVEAAGATGSLAGVLYHDIDGDGRYTDGTDTPLAGVQVAVTTADTAGLALLTAADGSYGATVPAGTTTVDVVDASLPAGLALTTDAHGEGSEPRDTNVPPDGAARVDVGYVSGAGATASLALDKQAALADGNGNGLADAGERIDYTLTVLNTGNLQLTGVVVEDALIALACTPSTPALLAPGAGLTCTGSLVVTSAQALAGAPVVNTATATGTAPDGAAVGDEDGTSTPVAAAAPALAIVKSLTHFDDHDASGAISAGDDLHYRVRATNAGNILLHAVTIEDPLLTPATAQCATLAVGAHCELAGTLRVTAAHVAAGGIHNTATAQADEAGPVSAELDTTIVDPAVGVSKRVLGVQGSGPFDLAFGIRVVNYGNTVLDEVQVLEDLAAAFPEPAAFTLLGIDASSPLVANPAFDGRGDTRLLAAGVSLVQGQGAELVLRVRVTPGAAREFTNLVVASATTAGGGPPVSDVSMDGGDPDPDGDGTPDETAPTPIVLGAPLPGPVSAPHMIPAGGPLGGMLMLLGMLAIAAAALRRQRVG